MDKLRTGIIGCGKIFPMHAVSVSKQERTELAAVCDTKKRPGRGDGREVRMQILYGLSGDDPDGEAGRGSYLHAPLSSS